MSTHRKLIVSAIAVAIAGTAVTTWWGHSEHKGGIPSNAQDASTASVHDPRALPALPAIAPVAVPRGVVSAPVAAIAHDAAKQAAVTRAEGLLEEEKKASAAAAGRTADTASLHAERYVPRDVTIEADGSEHVRLDRSYRGLPLVGGDLVVHSRNGQLLSTSHTLDLQVPDAAALAQTPRPQLSSQRAIDQASRHFDGDVVDPPVVASVYFAKNNRPTLAYEVHMVGLGADGVPKDERIYVDAADGALLGRHADIVSLAAQGTAYTLTRGKVAIDTTELKASADNSLGAGFVLKDPNRGDGETKDMENQPITYFFSVFLGSVNDIKPFFDTDNVWGDDQINLAQRVGADVHYGLAKTWDYYLKMHDRKGIFDDGKGVTAVANVKYEDVLLLPKTYTNAFWDQNLKTMFYLNGQAGVSNPVVALDVAGHEMSHGVNQATANLMYIGDAGGLNEANSDINGTQVEFFDASAEHPGNYLIGEDVFVSGKPFRYMFKPSLDTRMVKFGDHSYPIASVDCYPSGGFQTPDDTVSDEGQAAKLRVDPHFTSGVGNHFFYLLAEGAKVPASHRKTLGPADLVCNGNIKLTGITRERAGQIWYRALKLYMTSDESYPQAREATQQAAEDLASRGLLSKKDVNAVACTWDAVSVPLPKDSHAAQCTAAAATKTGS